MSLRARDALVLLAIVLAGLVLRMRDLPAHRPSPDEGNYMHSARLNVIGREGGPGLWLQQDKRWAKECVRDFSRAEGKTTYQHSYLEQWTMRMAYRFGASSFTSMRLSSALLGGLLSLALYGAARRMRLSRVTGLFAAAIAALAVVFVWYSRTGWGQIGCTFFYVAYLGLAYRLFDPEANHERRDYVLLGLGLTATSLLAYGWHEMIVVQVGWMGILAGLAPLGRRGYVAGLLKSPRTWTLTLSAIPTALLFYALMNSPWAQDNWLSDSIDGVQRTALERYQLAGRWLFKIVCIQAQITYPVLALALIGAITILKRRRFLFVFLVLSAVGSALMLFLKFNLPHLIRIYLPTLAVVALFAGQGLATIVDLAQRRGQRWLGWAVCVSLFGYLGVSSWQTLFGPHAGPLAVHPMEIFAVDEDPRWSSEPMLEVLDAELEPDEWVGIHQSFEMLFRVRDRGHKARMFNVPAPVDGQSFVAPRFVIGIPRNFEGTLNANFGAEHPYELVVREKVERFGLYRLR
jgi:hypothetical protein